MMDAFSRFGTFELNLRTLELRNRGIRLRLRQQSAEILAMLIGRPGEVITRTEIRSRLWPEGTFVEFEHSVNSAVNRLREVLGDSADNPRYIETIPKLGYRFIAPVTAADPPAPAASTPAPPAARPTHWRLAAVIAIFAAGAGLAGWKLNQSRSKPAPPIRSIAILPLLNLSQDPGQEYFADGMTEALTSNLGQIGSLRVISRTSAMTYKGSAKPLRTIAKELNVDAVVEGSVSSSGDRVRIVAQLIRSSSDAHIWSKTYEGDIRNVLRIQSEVAQAIVGEISAALSSQGTSRLAAAHRVNPEAYQAYLKGMFHLHKFTPDGFERGIAYLRQAIQGDPSAPFPYAALALGYAEMGHDRHPEAFNLSKEAALKSLESGAPQPEAFTALGMRAMYWDWDMPAASRHLQRALELNPSFAEARRDYAWYLNFMGQRDASIQEMRRAETLDPLEAQIASDLAWLYLFEGQMDSALAAAQRALEVNPSFAQALVIAGSVYLAKGLTEKALASQRSAMAADPAWRWALGRTLALLGRTVEARSLAAEIEKKPGPMDEWGLAVIYAALKDSDAAMRWLQAAYRSRFSWMPWNAAYSVASEDVFLNLRDDPRFKELDRRVRAFSDGGL